MKDTALSLKELPLLGEDEGEVEDYHISPIGSYPSGDY